MCGLGIDAFGASVVPQDSGPCCCAALDGKSVPEAALSICSKLWGNETCSITSSALSSVGDTVRLSALNNWFERLCPPGKEWPEVYSIISSICASSVGEAVKLRACMVFILRTA